MLQRLGSPLTMYTLRKDWKPGDGLLKLGACIAPPKGMSAAGRSGVLKLDEDRDGLKAGQLVFAISDGSVDSDFDVVDPNGWSLGEYQRNPLVLHMHNMDPTQPMLPIGIGSKTWVEGGVLYSAPEFSRAYPLAKLIEEMVREGILRMASVGFRPDKWTESDREGPWGKGLDISQQTLFEWSVVSRGANPNAFVQGAKAAGLDFAPYVAELERALDVAAPGERARLEAAWKAARLKRKQMDGGMDHDMMVRCMEACEASAKASDALREVLEQTIAPGMVQVREQLAANTAVAQALLARGEVEVEVEPPEPMESTRSAPLDVAALLNSFKAGLETA